jgi:hypothetical protein
MMVQLRSVSAAVVVLIGMVCIGSSSLRAQEVVEASPSAGASTSKQIRKAQRKAARTKKNAELKALEKNGFKQSGNPDNYPQNIQDAERKATASKAMTSTPAGQ